MKQEDEIWLTNENLRRFIYKRDCIENLEDALDLLTDINCVEGIEVGLAVKDKTKEADDLRLAPATTITVYIQFDLLRAQREFSTSLEGTEELLAFLDGLGLGYNRGE